MLELALHTVRTEWKAFIGWTVATVALVGSVLAFWPSLGDDPSFSQSLQDLPASVKSATGLSDLATPEGYLQGQLFSTLGPLIFLSFGIGRGARAIAGEEQAGTMDLLLATPIRRSTVVLAKAGALVAEMLALGLILWVTLLVICPLVDIELSAGRLGGAVLGNVALGAFYGALALALSSATGRRALSVAVAAGLAGAGFLYTSIAPFVSGLSDLLWVTPFQHAYGYEPLRNGLDLGDLALLVGGAAVLTVAAVALFDRRDVRG